MLKKQTSKQKSRKGGAPAVSEQAQSQKGLSKGSTNRGADLDHLESILKLMEKHGVAELEWKKSGEKLKLKTKHAGPSAQEYLATHLPGSFAPSAGQSFEKQNLLTLSAAPAAGAVSTKGSTPLSSSVESAQPAATKSSAKSDQQKQVVSPFVGTFYRSASPQSDPYVREGQQVKRGDVLCIVEAMKLMNEIEAEFPGKIVTVLAENGQPVEFGEPLFVIES